MQSLFNPNLQVQTEFSATVAGVGTNCQHTWNILSTVFQDSKLSNLESQLWAVVDTEDWRQSKIFELAGHLQSYYRNIANVIVVGAKFVERHETKLVGSDLFDLVATRVNESYQSKENKDSLSVSPVIANHVACKTALINFLTEQGITDVKII